MFCPARNYRPIPRSPASAPSGCGDCPNGHAPLTIAPVASALLRVSPAEDYRRLALELRVSDELPLDSIEAHLQSIGYEKRDPVEMVGEYSIRGGILDVFPADSARPLRIEFFGDEIESIRRFDVESQRSVMKISEARVLPLIEQPREGVAFPGWEFAAAMEHPRDQISEQGSPKAP